MKILGYDIGYDEPFWYFRAWEFGVFDDGWVLSHRRIIRAQGKWPRYSTFHRKRSYYR